MKAASPGRYGDGDGLHLFVLASEAAYWFTRGGKCARWAWAGPRRHNAVLLAEAREKAAPLYKQVKAGLDPLAELDAADAVKQVKAAEFARLAITFKQVAEEHLAANGAGWRNAKHRAQWAAP